MTMHHAQDAQVVIAELADPATLRNVIKSHGGVEAYCLTRHRLSPAMARLVRETVRPDTRGQGEDTPRSLAIAWYDKVRTPREDKPLEVMSPALPPAPIDPDVDVVVMTGSNARIGKAANVSDMRHYIRLAVMRSGQARIQGTIAHERVCLCLDNADIQRFYDRYRI